ncbi:MAG: phosphoribosylformylglycinamidine cyclo-ligase [Clostridiales bacterium]|jgi:phosphoribosylformylglycinamidine cyclo-ligase|nr:phosphoribosylformylglycinamidine cyclo-ligase [Clostridiales bacterium]
MKSQSESYKKAGVDITAGYKAVELIKGHIKKTTVTGMISDIGDFSGLFEPDLTGINRPVLVSGTDGVGTKLKVAFLTGIHNTIGIDCVAMCVNDIICCGAKPLFFLDYLALGKNIPETVSEIVSGVAAGCVKAGCGLVGGETAEMPSFYKEGEYDLAGFAVGIVDKDKVINNSEMKAGDVIIGLPSSGVHSNGYSLVRKVFDVENGSLNKKLPEYSGKTLGEVLLTPTEIYVKPMLALNKEVKIKGVSHITGGGFFENIPRCLKNGVSAVISRKALRIPPIFGIIATAGDVPDRDMFNTFNMGVGMMVIIGSSEADKSLDILKQNGIDAYIIGEIAEGEREVIIKN